MHRLTLFATVLTIAIGLITGGAFSQEQNARQLKLAVGDSQEFVLSEKVDMASIVNDDIADVIIRDKNKKHVLIEGYAPGSTDIILKNGDGGVIAHYTIRVHRDIDAINKAFETVMPKSDVKAVSVGGTVYLKGTVRDPDTAKTARSIAKQHVPEDAVTSRLAVNSARQVNLRVRVSEVRRTVSKDLGFDSSFSSGGADITYGNGPGDGGNLGVTTFAGAAQQALSGNTVGLAGSIGDASLSTIMDALEEKGMIRTLAEPNLTALSGETADMLAGGEIPVPVPSDGGNFGIEYREFGVGLTFKPTIKENGRISLKIKTRVSTLDNANGVTIGGTTVPAIAKRRASTQVEVPSGGGIAIAGLLKNDIESRIRGTSWAQDVPILGNLFSSSTFRSDRSELVITVTPYLVRPTNPERLADPATAIAPPSDADLFLMRKLSERYADGAETPQAARRNLGFMLDKTGGGPE